MEGDASDAMGAHPSAVANRSTCCACGRFNSPRFFPVVKNAEGAFMCTGRPCKLQIDEALFATSPVLCHMCAGLAGDQVAKVACDVCSRQYYTERLRYNVRVIDRVLSIGSHESVIFDGPVRTGRCCTTCYNKNMQALSRRREKRRRTVTHGEPQLEPLAKRTCPALPPQSAASSATHTLPDAQHVRDVPGVKCVSRAPVISSSSPVGPAEAAPVAVSLTTSAGRGAVPVHDGNAPSPAKRSFVVSLPALSSSGTGLTISRQLERIPPPATRVTPAPADTSSIVQTLVAIQAAKMDVISTLEVVTSFLSSKDTMQTAMSAAAKTPFSVAGFIVAQKRFVAMLAAEMRTIDDDQHYYAQELANITNKKKV